MMLKPLVSVVIPTFNRKEMVHALIESLLAGTYGSIEVIVIDDASTDGTFDYLDSKFKNNKKVKLFRNAKNIFAAGSKNIGQKHASGKYIAFIDDDNLADKKLIEELVNFMEGHPHAGQAGPINYVMSSKDKVLLSRSLRNMWTTKTTHVRSLALFKGQDYWETDDIPNAFIIRSDVVRQKNINFRTKFGIMYEESDYAYRIKKAGYKAYFVRNAKIYHDVRQKDKDFIDHFVNDSRRPYVFARNRLLFHALYSDTIQQLGILFFWCWFFSLFYMYKFLTYKGDSKTSGFNRVKIAFSYFMGTIKGILLTVFGDSKTYLLEK